MIRTFLIEDEAPALERLAAAILVVAIWLLWVLGAKQLMWTLIVVAALPGAGNARRA